MASAKISCFETASNSVMHDRNFMSSGEPRISVMGFSLGRQNEARAFDQARSEQVMLRITDGLGVRTDREALRHRAEAELDGRSHFLSFSEHL
jgi:hypothetical protein